MLQKGLGIRFFLPDIVMLIILSHKIYTPQIHIYIQTEIQWFDIFVRIHKVNGIRNLDKSLVDQLWSSPIVKPTQHWVLAAPGPYRLLTLKTNTIQAGHSRPRHHGLWQASGVCGTVWSFPEIHLFFRVFVLYRRLFWQYGLCISVCAAGALVYDTRDWRPESYRKPEERPFLSSGNPWRGDYTQVSSV